MSAPREPRPSPPAESRREYRRLWTIDDLCGYLGVPKQTIYRWRTVGYGPTAMKIGKHLRWFADDVVKWSSDQGDDWRST
jgi:predicted DNA-binding transcriptional regulator AlpA